jgi:hypothetical protein
VNASAYNPPNSHREDCVCFRRVPEAIHEVVLALHAVSLRLAFHEDFQVAVVFAIIVYGDPFLARRAIMVFWKPLPECIEFAMATVFIRHIFSKLLRRLIEAAVYLLMLFL